MFLLRDARRLTSLIVAIAVVVAIFVVVGGAAQAARQAEIGRHAAATYSPPPLSGAGDVVVIGDDLSAAGGAAAAATSWTRDVGESLGVVIIPLAADGAGYVGTASRSTFALQAARVPVSARVVVVFGGANDIRTPAVQLLRQVTLTIAAVRRAAPDARVLLVGPAWPRPVPQAVETVRSIEENGALLTGTRFVDPIQEHWFDSERDIVGQGDFHPTSVGRASLTTHMTDLLRGLVG